MAKRKFTKQALSQWMKGEGPESEVVISSRVRIARNLRNIPFPLMASPEQSLSAADLLLGVAESGRLSGLGKIEQIRLAELTELEKLVLENYTKFIMGVTPIEQFDSFVQNWNSLGGAEITTEVNEWAASQK